MAAGARTAEGGAVSEDMKPTSPWAEAGRALLAFAERVRKRRQTWLDVPDLRHDELMDLTRLGRDPERRDS
jgi:hypothetical protein